MDRWPIAWWTVTMKMIGHDTRETYYTGCLCASYGEDLKCLKCYWVCLNPCINVHQCSLIFSVPFFQVNFFCTLGLCMWFYILTKMWFYCTEIFIWSNRKWWHQHQIHPPCTLIDGVNTSMYTDHNVSVADKYSLHVWLLLSQGSEWLGAWSHIMCWNPACLIFLTL